MKNPTLDFAIDYVSRHPGRYLFPIMPGRKMPPLVQDNLNAASNDPEQIIAWHTRCPGCNWGLALAKSGLIVADVDRKAGKHGGSTYADLDLLYGFPATESVATPSGGLHHYYSGKHIFALGKSGFGDGMDSPNYVLIAGCTLKDGGEYKAAPETLAETADAPAWFYEVLKPKTATASVDQVAVVDWDKPENIEIARDYLSDDAPAAVEGDNGDQTTLYVAMTLHDLAISEGLAFELMAELYNPRCEPEWDLDGHAKTLRQKVRNAYAYASRVAPGGATAEADFADDPAPESTAEQLADADTAARVAKEVKAQKEIEKLVADWAYIGQQRQFIRRHDWCLYDFVSFNNYFTYIKPKGRTSRMTIGEYLLRQPPSPKSIARYNTFCYEPGKPQAFQGDFNLYMPPDIEAKEGDTSLWNAHLEYLFPDSESRDHVLNWCAWVLQNLDKKPRHALVIRGEKHGTGKSFIAEVLTRLVGERNHRAIAQSDLELPHNGWAMHTKLVTVEEIRAASSPGAIIKKLHSMISQDKLNVDEKNMKPIMLRNVMAFFLMSNKVDAIPMDDSDRRYLIIQTDVGPKVDAYYNERDGLYALLHNPEALTAIKWELEHRDLGDYTGAGRAPFTEAKAAMIEESADGIQQWMMEHAGEAPLNQRLITLSEITLEMPKHLHRSRMEAAIRDVLQRRFNGVAIENQIRPEGRNGPKLRVWAIGPRAKETAGLKGFELNIIYRRERGLRPVTAGRVPEPWE